MEIKKVTSFLKYKFAHPKKSNVEDKDIPYFLPYSNKLKTPTRNLNPQTQ